MAYYTTDSKNLCNICCETFNKSTRDKICCPCTNCDFSACKICTRTYLLSTIKIPSCMKCNGSWNEDFLKEKLNKIFIDGEYKQHRMKVLLDRQIALLPETMDDVENYKKAKEVLILVKESDKEYSILTKKFNFLVRNTRAVDKLKPEYKQEKDDLKEQLDTANLMRDSYVNIYQQRMNLYRGNGGAFQESEIKMNRKFIIACPSDDCKGFLDQTFNCPLCDTLVCSECHEKVVENQNHKCSKEAIATVKALQKETRSCPKCAVPIFKIDGCDQIWCVQCKTAFSWNTGEIETGRIHNPHYYEFLRKGGVLQREPGDNPCGGIREYNLEIQNILGVIYVASCTTNHGLNTFYCQDTTDYKYVEKRLKDIDSIMGCIHRYYGDIEHYITNSRIYVNTDCPYKLRHNRVKYLLNEINKDQLAKFSYLEERKRMFYTEMIHIRELLNNYFQDLYNDYYDDVQNLKTTFTEFISTNYNIYNPTQPDPKLEALYRNYNSFNHVYGYLRQKLEKYYNRAQNYNYKHTIKEKPLFDIQILKEFINKYNNKFIELEKLVEYVNQQFCRVSATYEESVPFYMLTINILPNNTKEITRISYDRSRKVGIKIWKDMKKNPSKNSVMGVPLSMWSSFIAYNNYTSYNQPEFAENQVINYPEILF